MGRRKRKVLSILAVSGLMTLAFVATKPVFAASNGQMINFCVTGTDYQNVHVDGLNQDGAREQVGFPLDEGACTLLRDYFWVGEVKLTWRDSPSGMPDRATTCFIPKEQELHTTTCTP